MEKRFTHLIYLGRFQPVHLGHEYVMKKAIELADNLIIICGSANRPRTFKNPFLFTERKDMICNVMKKFANPNNFTVVAAEDYWYNEEMWATGIQETVKTITRGYYKPRIGIIGCLKDSTSDYLNIFPQWELIDVDHFKVINATDIRVNYFSGQPLEVGKNISNEIYMFLEDFSKTKDFKQLQKEFDFVNDYKRIWSAAPYPPTFSTVDALVVQSAHILLVKRKAEPGKGLWALPGGFVGQDERLIDAMTRELKEETGLKVPVPVLKGSIKNQGGTIYDLPDRSSRGRTITVAFLIVLPDGPLSRVKGADDAEKAKWVPISELDDLSKEMFEDHYDIITNLLGKI